MQFDTLYKGKFLSVISPINDPYELVDESDIEICLPLIHKNLKTYIGIRKELIPPYLVKNANPDELYYTIQSGTMEDGEKPFDTLMREMKEEAGIEIQECTVLLQKNNFPVCKSTDIRCNFYIVDITKFNYSKPIGDGSTYEEKSKMVWIEESKIDSMLTKTNIDYLLYSSLYILKSILSAK